MNIPKLKPISSAKMSKPKILLLSDDLTTTSGIATMSRAFVEGTVDQFNWIQLAAAINHPESGKRIDISERVAKATGVDEASVILYPSDGYGDAKKLRKLLDSEKPDAILHFTDPRFWTWLYQIEDEIHQNYNIPIIYYAIWDNFPYPIWNKSAYASCDLIMGISKQSHHIHEQVLKYAGVQTLDLDKDDIDEQYNPNSVLLKYVPHGIKSNVYTVIDENHPDHDEFMHFKTKFIEMHGTEFIVLWNNRNIRRKSPADVIYGYELFTQIIGENNASKCALIMHTDPRDPNGTDLIQVKQMISRNSKVLFSTEKLDPKYLNFYYNLASVTVNIGSNEGFGLSSAESIMAGTPVINNVTGGLQDQLRFVDKNGKWFTPDTEVTSNHTKTYTECGEWAFPIWPSNISIQGSLATPYIFDDRVSPNDLANTIYCAWELGHSELKRRGAVGREWMVGPESQMSAENMSANIANSIKQLLKVWKPRPRYSLLNVQPVELNINTGITKYN